MVRFEKMVLLGMIFIVALLLTVMLLALQRSGIELDNAYYEVQRLSTECSGVKRPFRSSTGSAN